LQLSYLFRGFVGHFLKRLFNAQEG